VFADPQSITYSAVAKSLAAISRGESQSTYRLSDTGVIYELQLSHAFGKRNRAVARLRRDSYADDVLSDTSNVLASMTTTITVDFPTTGLTVTDAQALANALIAWATSANVLKLVSGET
jgi:hypothetical protein